MLFSHARDGFFYMFTMHNFVCVCVCGLQYLCSGRAIAFALFVVNVHVKQICTTDDERACTEAELYRERVGEHDKR